ncbi:MAG: hypothetical protein H7289_05780 [Mucilaginibacter sp.]|nr:hypothetical protein [Mucilaginibacter sp.]
MKLSYYYILGAIALLGSSCGNKNVSLSLKLAKEQRIDVKYRTSTNEDGIEKGEFIRMSLRVDSVMPDSSYLLSGKVDFVKVKNQKVTNSDEYSSDKPQAEMTPEEIKFDKEIRPTIDSTYKFIIDKYGKLLKPLTFTNGHTIPANFQVIDVGTFQINFPTEKIAIGGTWTTEETLPGSGGKRTSNYKLESIYDETIQIKVDGSIEGEHTDPQKFTGRYYLEKSNRTIDSCRIQMDGKGKQKITIDSK